MNTQHAAVLFLGIVLCLASIAQNGPPAGKKGRGENSTGIITVLTQNVTVTEGLFSDEWVSGDPGSNIRYYPSSLNGMDDPDSVGTPLADGDCVVIVTPAADGVDQGKLVFFAPFGPNDCSDPAKPRQLSVLGSGENLNGDNMGDPELIDIRFGCNDVFPNDSPVEEMGTTVTSCSLEVRKYAENDEFERTWIIEWPMVNVKHMEADLRQLDAASDAEIFELVPPAKGKGKKDKVLAGSKPLPFRFQIRRVRGP